MLNGWHDFRSDTVTQPTEAMREAMYRAEVGDAARGDDPTVAELEAEAAAMLGKEAALLVPSGTMGNLVALMTWTRRGDAIVVDHRAHVVTVEAAGLGGVAGCVAHTLTTPDGILRPEQVEEVLRPAGRPGPRAALVWVENTHNFAGGTVWDEAALQAVREVAGRHGVPVHMDGARIFNAAVALGVPAARLAQAADSIMFCLSKGLSAPIGSLLVGGRDFVEEARRRRQMVGGGMRQAGVVAAAGLVALRSMVDRLAEDHRRARALAERLAEVAGVRIWAGLTNMVMVDVSPCGLDAEAFGRQLAGERVLALAVGRDVLRFVTHRHVDDADVEAAARAVARVAAEAARSGRPTQARPASPVAL